MGFATKIEDERKGRRLRVKMFCISSGLGWAGYLFLTGRDSFFKKGRKGVDFAFVLNEVWAWLQAIFKKKGGKVLSLFVL